MIESTTQGSLTRDGRFELLAPLGAGGMGEVYRARAVGGGPEVVALKVLRRQASRSLRARFMREARLASQIQHPHIVSVQSYSKANSEQLYLAMQLIEGASLSRLIEAEIDAGALCALLIEVLEALAHVHVRGILHRDIKPDNILVARERGGRLRAWLTDFGIAGLLEESRDETRLTQEGAVIGTPDYMAPEQVHAHGALTPSVDLYPIGVMLYHALSARMPFEGSTLAVLMAKNSQDPPPPPNLERWPGGLWAVVERLLARETVARFHSASDVISALGAFAQTPRVSDDDWEALLAGDGGTSSTRPFQASASALETAGEARRSDTRQAPLWGRDAALARLEALAQQVEEGALQVVLIDGPIGCGKSSLCERFGFELAENGRALFMRGQYTTRSSGDGLRLALERVIGSVGRPAGEVAALVEGFMRRYGVEDVQERRAVVEFLRPSVATSTTREEDRGSGHHATILRLLRHIARRRPLILLLDDVHHDSADFAGFIESALVEASYEPLPLLVLATLQEEHAGAITRPLERFLLRQTLQRLSLPSIEPEAMIEGLVGSFGLSHPHAQHIAERSGGNPLFARLLAESDSQGASDLTAERSLPDQLRGLLMERLERRLDAEDPSLRALTSRVALLAPPVNAALLESFCDDLGVDFDDALDTLVGQGILVEDLLTDTIDFRHPLLGEALAATLEGRKTRKLHLRAATLRERLAGARIEAEAMAIGDHYSAGKRDDEALEWWLRALRYEIAAGEVRRGIRCGARALALLDAEDARAHALRVDLARLLREQGADLARAVALLEPLAARAPDIALPALELLCDIHQERSDFDAWTQTIEAMREMFPAAKEPASRHAFERAELFWLNNFKRHEEVRQRATHLLSSDPSRPDRLYLQIRLFWSLLMLGMREETGSFVGASVAREIDATDASCVSASMRGEILRVRALSRFRQGDVLGSLEAYEEAISLHRKTGRLARLLSAQEGKILSLLQLGRAEEAFACVETLQKMGANLSGDSRNVLFEYVARLLLERPISAALRAKIESLTRQIEEAESVVGVFQVLQSTLFQALALEACERGEGGEACARLRSLTFIVKGWGLSPQLLTRLGRGLIRFVHAHPEDDASRATTRWYLVTALEEWRGLFPDWDTTFIEALLHDLDEAIE